MNERDRALIAALAEGSLEDETEARSLLESSDEAQAEYRLQLGALQVLSDAGTATMLEAERADLHRALWTTLRAEEAKSRSTAGIYGWSMAAAALLVVVGLAAVLGSGILDQAQFGDDAALEAFEETSSALADGADTSAAEAEALDAPAAGTDSTVSPETEAFFAEQADRLRRGQEFHRTADGDPGDQTCLTSAGLPHHEVAAVLDEDSSAPVDSRYLAAVPAGEPIGPDTPIHFVDSDTCEAVYTDG